MFAAAKLARPLITNRLTTPLFTATKTKTKSPFAFTFAAFSKMTTTTLTSLPSVEVMQGFPDVQKINISDYCAGKNVIIVGLPGAFTPT
jgi:peroxiredoxin